MTKSDLPTERDFDPYGGDLDAQCAWKHFGGLTLEEANRKFREHSEYYEEDFMFMGGKAFAYYYPVIDSFLRETSNIPIDQRDDRQSWFLAHCIKFQFDGPDVPFIRHLKVRILDLVDFVRSNIALFSQDEDEQREIDAAWDELEKHLRSTEN